MMIRSTFRTTLVFAAFSVGTAALADRPDLSRFKPHDKLLLRQCLDMLEARPELYAHVTVDERRQQVLRFTKEPLSRANGKHPENPPAMADMPLVLLGLPMSPQAVRLLNGSVSQHNKAPRNGADRSEMPSQEPAVATPPPSSSIPISPRLETGAAVASARAPKFEIGEVKPVLTWFEKEFPTMAPLDKLLCLVAHEASINGGRVGSPNCYKGSGEFWVKEKEDWVRKIDELRKALASGRRDGRSGAEPGHPELLEAVGKLESATDDMNAAIADFRGTERVIAEILEKRKVGRDRDNITHVVADAMFGLSDEQLNNMEAKGGKWADQAEEYRRLRAEAQTALMRQLANDLALTFGYGEMSMRRMQPLVARAEVRRQQVVVGGRGSGTQHFVKR